MMSQKLNIIVVGASGKMGQTLIQEISNDSGLELTAALDQENCPLMNHDAGERLGLKTNVMISSELSADLKADIMIDFTRPEASLVYLDLCKKNKIKYVLGTTGFSDQEKQVIQSAANEIAICFAPNMSVGVNLLISLVEKTSQVLGHDFDIEIIESHHRHKVDSPSGTALRLGEAAAKSTNRSLDQHGVFERHGNDVARNASDIGFSVIRGGDIVGDHTVLFAADGERIELTHKASSRSTFAKGALRAAKFLADHETGLFDMRDVLKI